MELLGEWVMSNLISIRLETLLVSVHDRCTVDAIRTIGLEIILKAPDGTPRWHGSCGISFWPFGDSVSVGAR